MQLETKQAFIYLAFRHLYFQHLYFWHLAVWHLAFWHWAFWLWAFWHWVFWRTALRRFPLRFFLIPAAASSATVLNFCDQVFMVILHILMFFFFQTGNSRPLFFFPKCGLISAFALQLVLFGFFLPPYVAAGI